jgi:hypothetical protein
MTQLPSSGGEASTGTVVFPVAADRTEALLLLGGLRLQEASDAESVMTPTMIAVLTRRITPLLNQQIASTGEIHGSTVRFRHQPKLMSENSRS